MPGLRSVRTHASHAEPPACPTSCVCVCVHVHTHVSVHLSLCTLVCMCVHTCACVCTRVPCSSACAHACQLHLCMYTRQMCVRVCVHNSMCTCVPLRVCTCMHVCVRVHMCRRPLSWRPPEQGSPCHPRQAVSHPPGAELETTSWLLRLTKGIFKHVFYLSNPCYFV